MNFKQAMIVPTMVSLGVGTLLFAKTLQLEEVSYAQTAANGPAGAINRAKGAAGAMDQARKGQGGAAPGPGALPLPAGAAASSPEFGGINGAPKVIRAISDTELTLKAVEASGREDPFMALVPPDPGAIAPPPVTFAPIKPIPALLPAVPPKPRTEVPKPSTVKPPTIKAPRVDDLPFAGDKAPPPSEPQWLVRGIMSTAGDRISLLEGRDGSLHARVGDVLSDGSKVVAISNRGVTFIRGGRRFVKQIGDIN